MRRTKKLITAFFMAALATMFVPNLAQASTLVGGFYCPGASHTVTCLPCRADLGEQCVQSPFNTGLYFTNLKIRVYNHANYGEACEVIVLDPYTPRGRIYINAGDTGEHPIGGLINPNTKYELECQRRGVSGDAGIGGYLYR